MAGWCFKSYHDVDDDRHRLRPPENCLHARVSLAWDAEFHMLSSRDLVFGDDPEAGAVTDSLGMSYFEACNQDAGMPSTSWLHG